MKVLVAGGAGYIGSTVCSALKEAGHTPIVLDSLIRGKEEFARAKCFLQRRYCRLRNSAKDYTRTRAY